jgi:hypothetical protein
MDNLLPFANHASGFNAARAGIAAEYIRRNFASRNNCRASAAYNRAALRDACAALRCGKALGVVKC